MTKMSNLVLRIVTQCIWKMLFFSWLAVKTFEFAYLFQTSRETSLIYFDNFPLNGRCWNGYNINFNSHGTFVSQCRLITIQLNLTAILINYNVPNNVLVCSLMSACWFVNGLPNKAVKTGFNICCDYSGSLLWNWKGLTKYLQSKRKNDGSLQVLSFVPNSCWGSRSITHQNVNKIQ